MTEKSRFYPTLTLAVILLIAAGLRFYNLNWDNGIFAHPDERSTVAFYAPTIHWPDESTPLLDPRESPLNPFWNVERQERRSYTYGHFPLYTLVLLANFLHSLVPFVVSLPFQLPPEVTQFLATSTTGQGYAHLGRFLAGLSDLFSIYLLFLIGRQLYGAWGGVLAATFSTFTVLQIQLAHFFAVDPISTTFTLLALYGSILLYDRKSVGAAVITGIGIALAVASKFSALPVVFLPVVAAYFAVHRQNADSNRNNDQTTLQPESLTSRMIGLVLLALAVSFVLFAITSPFVLLDFENFRRAVLDEQGNMVSGMADFPFTRQYRNTTPYLYFIEQQMRWGMGWTLGLLGLVGTGWVALRAIGGKARVGEYLALLWIALYFGPTGLFLAKFMRYMVPVVPLVNLFSAGLIIALWRYRPKPAPQSTRWANGERAGLETNAVKSPNLHFSISNLQSLISKFTKPFALALAAIALTGAVIWSLAFTNGVYGSEHTWVTFSRWLYNNVPDGSCIAYEHWDDRLPTGIPEPDGSPEAHQFRQPQLPMYDEDTQQKYELLRDTLMNCDYVVLATNRLWRTIPRLPERYPMSTRYYRALFNGELGFELAHTTETPPRLAGLVFDDQAADESFTVYDHPKPMLFKKTRQLSAEEWDEILGGTWQQAVSGYVGSTTLLMRLRGTPNTFSSAQVGPTLEEKRTLLLDTPVDQLPVVNDFRWNDIANNSSFIAVALWWLAMMITGLLFLPLTTLLFNKLPDYGYGLSKSLGLLLVSYPVWIISSLIGSGWLGNTLSTAIMAVIIFAIINVVILVSKGRDLVQIWAARRWNILFSEIVFSVVFLLFIYLRLLNPDLWHPWLGGEKMLEIGFLNAVVKSAQMPPYDPFFAGGIINYYYYGLFLVGVLIKLTGIQPSIAFNLAVPTLAALTAVNAFSLAGNLAMSLAKTAGRLRYITSGLFAALFIVFLGNLEGAAQFMRNLADMNLADLNTAIPGLGTLLLAVGGFFQVLTGDSIAVYNYWDPTRVIPETINEFPFFSFLFADLHPHMIGIPFTLLFLSLAFNWLRSAPDTENSGLNAYAPSRSLTGVVGHRPTSSENSEVKFSIFNFVRSLPVGQFTISTLLRWLALPFVLGAIAAINTWDLPTYLGLMLATFTLKQYRQTRSDLSMLDIGKILIGSALFAAALLVTTYLLYLPFFASYQPPAETGVGFVHTKTPFDQHFKIWGFFLFIIATWLLISLAYPASRNSLLRVIKLFLRRWNVLPHLSEHYRTLVKRRRDAYQVGLWAVGLTLLVAMILLLVGYRVPFYLLPLAVVALLLLLRREVTAGTAYLDVLTFTGLLVLLGVEFVFLRDFLGGGSYYRMNTLFKFFIQVWIMFGIAAAVMLPQLWDWAWRWSLPTQIIWRGAAVILLLAGLIYPILGTRTRVDDRFPGVENRPPIGTLDGLAYMTVGAFEWPAGNPIDLHYDYEAIQWLQENVEGTPILAEAKIGYYREGGMRVAAYTGLPSILGGLHQNEQRHASQVGARDGLVNEFWNTPNPARTLDLIDTLGISYIYIGQVERAAYGDQVGDKFEQLRTQGELELVFENEETRIYRR